MVTQIHRICDGGVYPEGASTGPMPFFDVKDPELWCKDQRTLLFSDVADDAKAQEYVALMRPQPGAGWDGMIKYAGWKENPSGYLICKNDKIIPMEMQMQFAQLAGSKVVESCQAGHMALLTAPEAVVNFIRKSLA